MRKNRLKLHILEIQKFCKKFHNFSENMAKIDALFTKSLAFLIQILNFPPPPAWAFRKIYTHGQQKTFPPESWFEDRIIKSIELSLSFSQDQHLVTVIKLVIRTHQKTQTRKKPNRMLSPVPRESHSGVFTCVSQKCLYNKLLS